MELSFDNFELYREATLGWGLDFTQLDCGPFAGLLRQVTAPKVSLTHFTLNRHFYQRGEIRAPGRTFAIFLNRITPMRWQNSTAVDSETLVIFPEDGALDSVTFPGFDAVSISVDPGLLTRTAQENGFERALEALPRHAMNFQTDGQVIAALRVRVRTLQKQPESGLASVYLCELEGEIAYLVLKALSLRMGRESRSSHRMRDRAFKAALDILDRAPDPPSIPELCRMAGASERTLRNAFQERLGVAPKHYVNAMRLKRVREKLLDGPASASPVQDIAASFGFWHTGQFAADYRRLFGELPSETLSRAMRHQG